MSQPLRSWTPGPTLAVTPTLDHTTTARAGVPSRASTGSRKATEGLTAFDRHGG
jgi:enolase